MNLLFLLLKDAETGQVTKASLWEEGILGQTHTHTLHQFLLYQSLTWRLFVVQSILYKTVECALKFGICYSIIIRTTVVLGWC